MPKGWVPPLPLQAGPGPAWAQAGPRPAGRGPGRAGSAPAKMWKIRKIHFPGARKVFFKTPPDVLQRAREQFPKYQSPHFSAPDRCFESCGLNISFMGRIPESQTVLLSTSSGKGGRRRRRRRRRRPPRSYHRQVGYVVYAANLSDLRRSLTYIYICSQSE